MSTGSTRYGGLRAMSTRSTRYGDLRAMVDYDGGGKQIVRPTVDRLPELPSMPPTGSAATAVSDCSTWLQSRLGVRRITSGGATRCATSGAGRSARSRSTRRREAANYETITLKRLECDVIRTMASRVSEPRPTTREKQQQQQPRRAVLKQPKPLLTVSLHPPVRGVFRGASQQRLQSTAVTPMFVGVRSGNESLERAIAVLRDRELTVRLLTPAATARPSANDVTKEAPTTRVSVDGQESTDETETAGCSVSVTATDTASIVDVSDSSDRAESAETAIDPDSAAASVDDLIEDVIKMHPHQLTTSRSMNVSPPLLHAIHIEKRASGNITQVMVTERSSQYQTAVTPGEVESNDSDSEVKSSLLPRDNKSHLIDVTIIESSMASCATSPSEVPNEVLTSAHVTSSITEHYQNTTDVTLRLRESDEQRIVGPDPSPEQRVDSVMGHNSVLPSGHDSNPVNDTRERCDESNSFSAASLDSASTPYDGQLVTSLANFIRYTSADENPLESDPTPSTRGPNSNEDPTSTSDSALEGRQDGHDSPSAGADEADDESDQVVADRNGEVDEVADDEPRAGERRGNNRVVRFDDNATKVHVYRVASPELMKEPTQSSDCNPSTDTNVR